MNGCSIGVGVAENVFWSRFGIDIDQASVAQQEFRNSSPATAIGNPEVLEPATRCVSLRNRRDCRDQSDQESAKPNTNCAV